MFEQELDEVHVPVGCGPVQSRHFIIPGAGIKALSQEEFDNRSSTELASPDKRQLDVSRRIVAEPKPCRCDKPYARFESLLVDNEASYQNLRGRLRLRR